MRADCKGHVAVAVTLEDDRRRLLVLVGVAVCRRELHHDAVALLNRRSGQFYVPSCDPAWRGRCLQAEHLLDERADRGRIAEQFLAQRLIAGDGDHALAEHAAHGM